MSKYKEITFFLNKCFSETKDSSLGRQINFEKEIWKETKLLALMYIVFAWEVLAREQSLSWE